VGDCTLLKGVRDHEPTPTNTDFSWVDHAPVGHTPSWTGTTTLHQSTTNPVEAKSFPTLPSGQLPSGKGEPTNTIGDDLDALVGAAVDGERYAIEGVLRWVLPLVVRYCRARIGAQERMFASADDVAQEVCLAVLTALPGYRDQGKPFLVFVYGIAAHKVADSYRSSARNRDEPVPEVPDTPDLADGPEVQAMRVEMARWMAKLLDTLPEKQREILRLRFVVGLSAEETSVALGSTPGAVRVAQHRALNRLRGILPSPPQVLYRGVWVRS
jgi:RNA polymerase sigma-70 factor, ECF subfamily